MRDEEYEVYQVYLQKRQKAAGPVREKRPVWAGGSGRGPAKTSAGGRRKGSPLRLAGRTAAALLILAVILTVSAAGVLAGALPERYKISPQTGEGTDPAAEEYMTLALFGLDARDGNLVEGNNRSDCIITASVSRKTGKIRLLSVFRDTYLNTWDNVCTKANAAYARGGPQMAVSMLNRNFDLNITDFVSIGFLGLADMIDALGGLDLDLTPEEVGYVNDYIRDMNRENGTCPDKLEWTSGIEHLTGIQAVAFCRIRYTQGDDFKRTSRQREVLSAMLEKAKKAGPSGWKKAFRVFSESGFIATSLSDREILWLLSRALSMEIEDTKGLPDQDHRTTGMVDGQDCVIPLPLTETASGVHSFLYDSEDYKPSETVEKISARIREDTQ